MHCPAMSISESNCEQRFSQIVYHPHFCARQGHRLHNRMPCKDKLSGLTKALLGHVHASIFVSTEQRCL